MKYVIGIDVGTSSLSGILVNERGEVLTSASESYRIITIKSGYNEQDPVDWYNAFCKVAKELISYAPDISRNIEGISFAGQMHSLVRLDDEGNAIGNAILWNDTRTKQECERITKEIDVIKITKNKAVEGFTLPKILWLQEHDFESWKKTKTILLPKDYMVYRLTGNKVMDKSDASGTLIYDFKHECWSEEILNHFDLDLGIMPKIVNSTDFVGHMDALLCRKLGLLTIPKVFAGAGDNSAAALGAGIFKKGDALLSIGTSGVILAFEDDIDVDYKGELHYFHHSIERSYYSMGVTLSAGHSLSWFKNNFAKSISFTDLMNEISEVPIGSSGLLFTPYLNGERTPHTDATIRGSFIGVSAEHNLKTFTRAVVEGITFSLKESYDIMFENGIELERIVSTGGGARSVEWLQIQADILGVEIKTLQSAEGPTMGAAMIAALGLRWFESAKECGKSFISYGESYVPSPSNHKKYNELYKIYKQIYSNTKDINMQLKEYRK
ncbi:xylulokinase [Erysipelothrix urinaevulpis]|uniref:xylulokinase n=1 Tax=Erysipelothrix urinaevulpis TaxID=2683717 RepID=UPI0013588B81|nr:xylulokinase [Erysipelothrix urinaevulpis]